MLRNSLTSGYLVANSLEKLPSSEESYVCTTSDKVERACARSVFIIEKVKSGDNLVQYGEEIRLVTVPELSK